MKIKKQTYIILILLICIFCFNLNAQVKTKVFYTDIPMRFKSQMKAISKTYKIETPAEFHSRKQKNLTEETQFAIPVKVNIAFLKEAIVEEDELIRTYSLILEAKDALNVSLQFSEFNLPENAILSIYTQNELTDSITSSQNNINNIWATKVYQGNTLSIVLKIPLSSQEKIALKIGAVNFGYKKFGVQFDFGNIGASAPCHINANCPLGDNWNNEKNSVAMIVANGTEQCTGSLIMNACNTNNPYFLTADHCLDAGNVPNWVFQFQTWSTDCATNTGWREDIQFNGCQLRANNAATDFALLELNTPPPANSGLFYSGWSRDIIGNTSTTVLHHPRGDLMKISVDNQVPVPAITITGGNAWQIDQDFGRLEGGSSGAPYYNQNHQIIGQHWRRPEVGTRPVCDITIAQGGRFDLSWTGGGTNATRLSNWLDPNNLGSMTTNTTSINNLLNVSNTTNQIVGSNIICSEGSTANYSLVVPNGFVVTWSATGSVSINPNTGVATAIGRGLGIITATVSGGPCGNVQFTKTVWVGVPAQPSALNGPSFANVGASYQYSAGSAMGATSYNWSIIHEIHPLLIPAGWSFLFNTIYTGLTANVSIGTENGFISV